MEKFKRLFDRRDKRAITNGTENASSEKQALMDCTSSINHDEKRPQSLETIPSDIISKIAQLLSPVDRACLALVSRSLLSSFGGSPSNSKHVFGDLDDESRYNLLLYLSGDGMYICDHVLCQWCRKFHSPWPTSTWGADAALLHYSKVTDRPVDETWRQCEQYPGHWQCLNFSIVLPSALHFNMVKFWMFRDKMLSVIGDVPREPLMTYNQTYSLPGGHELFSQNTFKIVKVGRKSKQVCNLIVKTETFIRLGRTQNDEAIMQSISEVSKALTNTSVHDVFIPYSVKKICQHYCWYSFADVFEDADGTYYSAFLGPRHVKVSPMSRRNMWVRSHDTQERRAKKVKKDYGNYNNIRQCDKCHTDYALSFLPRPEKEKTGVCVLTTWKNLGTGQSVSDDKWQSHLHWYLEGWKKPTDDWMGNQKVNRSGDNWDIANTYEGRNSTNMKLSWTLALTYYPSDPKECGRVQDL